MIVDDLARLATSLAVAPGAVTVAMRAMIRTEAHRTANDAKATVAKLTGATAAGINVHEYAASVAVVASDEASFYLEYGTSDTAPQPFMRPAGARAEARIHGLTDAIVERAITGALW